MLYWCDTCTVREFLFSYVYVTTMGPFKCYVTQMGVGGVRFSRKKRYEGVMFNVNSVTRGWVGVQFPEKWGVRFSRKKRYEGVIFNVNSVTRGWVGVQFPEK